jgi:hypothetical protein
VLLTVFVIGMVVLFDIAVRAMEDTVLNAVAGAGTAAIQVAGTPAAAVAAETASALSCAAVVAAFLVGAILVPTVRMAATAAAAAVAAAAATATTTAVALCQGDAEGVEGPARSNGQDKKGEGQERRCRRGPQQTSFDHGVPLRFSGCRAALRKGLPAEPEFMVG